MFTNSTVKLMDRLERDAEGMPTGGYRQRPNYDVMMSRPAYEAYNQHDDAGTVTNPLDAYLHQPEFIDDCWAGQETIYLRFTTEAECKAKLNKYLLQQD